MSKNIYIIGAGQLGSRHLQALKQVQESLNITVVDPTDSSLVTARERYEGTPGIAHSISYLKQLPTLTGKIDVAIVACNANVRKAVLETLLTNFQVRYLILEKLLFDKLSDYELIAEQLKNLPTKTFVNCAMRMIPFYAEAKSYFKGQKVTLSVNGSKYGLASNAIHYLDLLSYYTGENRFSIQTESLDSGLIESKRPGYKEFSGTLMANYQDGSRAILNCLRDGSLPFQVEISTSKVRIISREWEQKAWISEEDNGWKWLEVEAKIPYQSQLTAKLVNDLFARGTCDLVSFEESKQIHLNFLTGIEAYLVKNSGSADRFPFT